MFFQLSITMASHHGGLLKKYYKRFNIELMNPLFDSSSYIIL